MCRPCDSFASRFAPCGSRGDSLSQQFFQHHCQAVTGGVVWVQVFLYLRLCRTEPLPLLVPGCLGQEFCNPAASFRKEPSLWLLGGFRSRVSRCLCSLAVYWIHLPIVSFLWSFSVAAPLRVVSWSKMSRAHGSALNVCFFFAVSVLDGRVSPRSLVSGEEESPESLQRQCRRTNRPSFSMIQWLVSKFFAALTDASTRDDLAELYQDIVQNEILSPHAFRVEPQPVD